MQSDTADFASVPPPGELDETCVVVASGPFAPSSENVTSFITPEVHNVLHCYQTGSSHGHRQHEQKIWTCRLRDIRADRQIDRHSDTLITTVTHLTGGEVIITCVWGRERSCWHEVAAVVILCGWGGKRMTSMRPTASLVCNMTTAKIRRQILTLSCCDD